ncbi:hypothetical protein JB92DRAFT_2960614, partial [Gautieria morchelliformis]
PATHSPSCFFALFRRLALAFSSVLRTRSRVVLAPTRRPRRDAATSSSWGRSFLQRNPNNPIIGRTTMRHAPCNRRRPSSSIR